MLVLAVKGQKHWINSLAFSPAGDALIAAGSWLDVWRFDGSPPERFFEAAGTSSRVSDARFVADGTAIVAACGTDGLRVQSLTPDSPIAAETYQSRAALLTLAVHADGRIVGITRPQYIQPLVPAGYQCWVPDGGRFRPTWFNVTSSSWPAGLTLLSDGRRFVSTELTRDATGEREAALVVRSFETGEPQESHDCPYVFVEQLLVSPDGEQLLARSGMGLAIWPAGELSRKPRKLLNDNRKHFTGVAFHPSGRYLAATSNDATVKLFDTATWQPTKAFTWQVGRLRSVAFSPDGTRAAVGSATGKVVVWDVDV
jgi:WD40 repeat protein